MSDLTLRASAGQSITKEDLQRRYGLSPEDAKLLLTDHDFISYATSSASSSASTAKLIQELNTATEQLDKLAGKKPSR